MSWSESISRHKKMTVELLLESSPLVKLVLETRGCILPEHLHKGDTVTLDFGYELARRIPDLDIGDEAITCTLSFNNVPCRVMLPYSSLLAAGPAGESLVIWTRADEAPKPDVLPPARPKLRLVD